MIISAFRTVVDNRETIIGIILFHERLHERLRPSSSRVINLTAVALASPAGGADDVTGASMYSFIHLKADDLKVDS